MRLSKLIGKKVYTTDALYFSEIKDFFVEVGKGGGDVLGLTVRKTKKGIIPFSKVAAVGDIILVEKG